MIKRLKNELKELEKFPDDNFTIKIINNNIYTWEALLYGPKDTIFENGKFKLSILIPEYYPFKPPIIKFMTPIYHPNISIMGDICLNILNNDWSPILNIRKTLLGICVLLNNPNIDDPLRTDIAKIYVNNINEYKDNVIKYNKKFANK